MEWCACRPEVFTFSAVQYVWMKVVFIGVVTYYLHMSLYKMACVILIE